MRIKNNGSSCTINRVAFFTGDELNISDDAVPAIQYALDSGWFSEVPVPVVPVADAPETDDSATPKKRAPTGKARKPS